ncbi:DUF3795 domain-containing protein [candidate division KSB1 bacterium]
MERRISICGLVCSDCPAFIATQADDDEARVKTAQEWSKQYNSDIKPEHINCDGCYPGDGKLFHYPTICEIRKCGFEKGVINCAYCDEYACDKLTEFFKLVPAAKTALDEIRKGL